MSFDGITTNALVHELNDLLQNARIEKINIPNKNEITIANGTANGCIGTPKKNKKVDSHTTAARNIKSENPSW